jgi:hypothetical protein
MLKTILAIVLVIVAVVLVIKGYFESSKDNTVNFDKMNATIISYTILSIDKKDNAGSIGFGETQLNFKQTVTYYSVQYTYEYEIGGVKHTGIFYDNNIKVPSYLEKNKQLLDNLAKTIKDTTIEVFVSKTNNSVSDITIEKNSSFGYYIFGTVCFIAGLVTYFGNIDFSSLRSNRSSNTLNISL